ncbi:MAG TPA: NADH-quinone oxidoreductase subunit M [Polyangiaceae bacterium]|nr:NADH-quinone oxidoreductase subunit M [Polyangiaceae bacterium]
MNPLLGSLVGLWPVALAGFVGAVVPRRDSKFERVLLAAVAALVVLFTMAVWPGASTTPEDSLPKPEWPHLLNVLIGLPLLGSVAVLFLPRQSPKLLRAFTLGVLLLTLGASLFLLTVPMTRGWHFVYVKDWMPTLGIRYHVALDGISLWLVLLTAFITPIAAYASFGTIKTRLKELCFAYLFLQAAMIGAFVALDLFLFYMFWELMLIPMYLMIGIWGGTDKIKAAIKFFIYTMTGSVLMLAAMIYLVWQYTKLTGAPSFDLLALQRVVLPPGAQLLCFWAFALAFFIKVPMFPVHTWLPDAHVQAPTGGSVILAAIMLKLGTYGYLRFAMGLFPGASGLSAANLAGVAVMGGIIYGALVAYKQDDLKRVIAYSSVAHLGYVMLGLFAVTPSSISGSILQMVNHGISTGALFLLVGVIYDRRHTREIAEFGGLAKVMPVYTAVWVVITLASIGVPGTNGFIGEFMVITGTMISPRLRVFAGVDATIAAAGVILGAVYMLTLTQKTFFGPLTNPKNKRLADLSTRETIALAPLVLFVFVIGLFPSIFLDRTKDSVQAFFERYQAVWAEGRNEEPASRLLRPSSDPAQERGAPVQGESPSADGAR